MINLDNKKVLITGCAGTVGRQLLENILASWPKCKIIGVDNDESQLFGLTRDYRFRNVNFELCDIRSDSITQFMSGASYVLHCAAYKHVFFGENNPDELKDVNLDGLQNLIKAAIHNNVVKFIFTSSDKAVNPTSTMGVTKLLGERIVSAADRLSETVFSTVRFGNVIGSSGSVYEIFYNQIQEKEKMTLTHEDMSRFIMSKREAADLVLRSAEIGVGGEVMVTKMPVLLIKDLGLAMHGLFSEVLSDDVFEITGGMSEEKIFEELLTNEEASRAVDCDDFYVLHSDKAKIQPSMKIANADYAGYRSDTEEKMTISEIKEFIMSELSE